MFNISTLTDLNSHASWGSLTDDAQQDKPKLQPLKEIHIGQF